MVDHLHVGLIRQARRALKELQSRHHDANDANLVNHALTLYAFVDAAVQDGGRLALLNADGTTQVISWTFGAQGGDDDRRHHTHTEQESSDE